MLIIDTNIVRETCEVTFNETAPCNSSVFEVAGDDELGTSIFEDEEEEAADGEAEATTRAVDPAISLHFEEIGRGARVPYALPYPAAAPSSAI